MIVDQAEAAKPKQTKTHSGSWLIFADSQGIGQQLGVLLRSLEGICTLVFPGIEYEQIAEQEFRINPENLGDFQRLLLEVVKIAKPPILGVVYLWSLDAIEAGALTIANLDVASQAVCGSALFLTQSLVEMEFTQPPALWLVTLGAQRVGRESNLAGVAQSTLWGLGKVIANEHTELNCTLVDLDPLANDNAQALFAELRSQKPVGENLLAFRNGQRYVAQLIRSSKFVQKPLRLVADATYLITGGLGGIGLLVAKWMVEHGAKHLVLLSRSSPTDAAKKPLKALEQTGVQVVVVQADVSQTEQVARVLAQIKTFMPQLRGIIHSAGISEDRLVVDHQWELFAKVFAPKVSGAWNLHTLTQDLPLDFFVLFSSVASMFGASGLGNYAAANAFLDTLAHYRRLQGLPGLSINWGPWSMVGMAQAVGSRRESQWVAQGVNPMEPQQALAIFEVLLQQDTAQVGVMQVDWSKYLQQFQLGAYPALISELAHKVQQIASSEQQKAQLLPQFLEQLKTASTESSLELITVYLQDKIAKVLGLNPPQLDVNELLNHMGLDSLMVIELKNRVRTELGVDIPTVKFMEGQSVASIATHVSRQLTEIRSTSVACVTSIAKSSQHSWIEGEL